MGAARILLIENNRAKGQSFAGALQKRYEVISVPSGKQALDQAAQRPPHAVVLDAISMRTPGYRICETLREKLPETPLIHLHPGPKGTEDSPADVVLYLPFTARKLVNCIERLAHVATVENDEIVVCGPFSIQPGRRMLLFHGQETQLTPKLALLVETFLRNPGQTLDRKMLMERIWHTDYMGDTRTLDVHVRWFRQMIESDPGTPRYLKTVRGVGYRLELSETQSMLVPETLVAVPGL